MQPLLPQMLLHQLRLEWGQERQQDWLQDWLPRPLLPNGPKKVQSPSLHQSLPPNLQHCRQRPQSPHQQWPQLQPQLSPFLQGSSCNDCPSFMSAGALLLCNVTLPLSGWKACAWRTQCKGDGYQHLHFHSLGRPVSFFPGHSGTSCCHNRHSILHLVKSLLSIRFVAGRSGLRSQLSSEQLLPQASQQLLSQHPVLVPVLLQDSPNQSALLAPSAAFLEPVLRLKKCPHQSRLQKWSVFQFLPVQHSMPLLLSLYLRWTLNRSQDDSDKAHLSGITAPFLSSIYYQETASNRKKCALSMILRQVLRM